MTSRAVRRGRWHSRREARSGRSPGSPRREGRAQAVTFPEEVTFPEAITLTEEVDLPQPEEEAVVLTEADAVTEAEAVAEGEAVAVPEAAPDGAAREDPTDGETHGAALSLTEAALVCGRHGSKLRRYLTGKRFPNAHRDSGGAWRIPIADLVSAGLLPRALPDGPKALAEMETALERQQAENAELRRRIAVAEALADERAERIEDLRLSLRLLMGPDPSDDVVETPGPILRPLVWSGEITLEDPSRL
jgi:virulence-associated protein VagC